MIKLEGQVGARVHPPPGLLPDQEVEAVPFRGADRGQKGGARVGGLEGDEDAVAPLRDGREPIVRLRGPEDLEARLKGVHGGERDTTDTPLASAGM